MNVVAIVLAGAIAASALDCHSSVEPVNPPSDSPSSSCAVSCARLHAVPECLEGHDVDACARACTASKGDPVGATIDWDCIDRAAPTADAVRHCGVRLCVKTASE